MPRISCFAALLFALPPHLCYLRGFRTAAGPAVPHGRPEMRTMRPLLAVGFLLAASPVVAQLPAESWFSPCDGPIATCVSPQPSHHLRYVLLASEPKSIPPQSASSVCDASAFSPSRPAGGLPTTVTLDEQFAFYDPPLAPIPDDAHEVLGRWALASRAHLPATAAERLRLRYDDARRSGQEAALTCELQGPVNADELARRYHWSVTDDVDAVELTAVPVDPLERLFYDRFAVLLDAATWRPIRLRFTTPGGGGRSVVLRPIVDFDASSIRLASHESRRAAPLLRTASFSDDLPLPARQAAPLAVPPAPASCALPIPLAPAEAAKP